MEPLTGRRKDSLTSLFWEGPPFFRDTLEIPTSMGAKSDAVNEYLANILTVFSGKTYFHSLIDFCCFSHSSVSDLL